MENLAVDWLQDGEEEVYAERADAVVAALAELLPERAEQVRPLLQRTLELLVDAAGCSEDHCGAVLASAAETWDVFLAACDEAPPDPADLGRWFARFRLTGVDVLDVSVSDVADLLGTAGLDAYRNALEAARAADPGGWTVRSLREEMIEAVGDVDALVACYAEDLSTPDRHVLVARLLREQQRPAEAVEWLERGRAATGRFDHRTEPLVALLIELYTEAGRTEDVLTLHWERFRAEGTVGSYQRLRECTLATDPQQWPRRCEEALELLRARAISSGCGYAGDAWDAGEVCLRVLLSEDRDETAWQMLDQVRCAESTRLAVADRRAASHPAEALQVYLPVVERAVGRANLAETLATLTEYGLAWVDEGNHLRQPRGAAAGWPQPLNLGRPLAAFLKDLDFERAKQLARMHNLMLHGGKQALTERLTAHLSSHDRVVGIVATGPARIEDLLRPFVWDRPVGTAHGIPAGHLLDRVGALLDLAAKAPLATVKTGGVGQREIKRVARLLRCADDEIRVLLTALSQLPPGTGVDPAELAGGSGEREPFGRGSPVGEAPGIVGYVRWLCPVYPTRLVDGWISSIVAEARLLGVVTGPPSAELARVLDRLADWESRATASIWRFSPATVRRAFDEGLTEQRILADLAAIAAGGLPQPPDCTCWRRPCWPVNSRRSRPWRWCARPGVPRCRPGWTAPRRSDALTSQLPGGPRCAYRPEVRRERGAAASRGACRGHGRRSARAAPCAAVPAAPPR